MELAGALGLVAVLFVKEAGVPIPVPGDLLVLGAGVATAGNPAVAVAVLIAILIAGYLGGVVQFLLVRGALRRALIGLLTRFGVPQARIDALTDRLRRTGSRGVAVARVTPGVRVPAIVASGLAALPVPAFVVGLVIGNSLFVGAHFLLGFVIGAPAVAIIQGSGLVVGIVALVVLAVIGALGWIVLRRRRGAKAPLVAASVRSDDAETFTSWADAACPACLALAVIRPFDRSGSPGD